MVGSPNAVFVARVLLLVCALCGCSQQAMFEKFVPPAEQAFAREVVEKLAAHDFAAVEAVLNPALQKPDARQKLEELARLLPAEAPKSSHVVGAQKRVLGAVTSYDVTFEREYPRSWVLARVTLEKQDEKLTVQGLHLNPRTQSLANENRFTLENKGALHHLVLVLALSTVAFVLFTLVLWVRTKIAKRKWLWLLFTAVGVFQLNLNWTTGEWGIRPAGMTLFGAGFARASTEAPLMLQVAIPIGAIVFLIFRRSLERTPTPRATPA